MAFAGCTQTKNEAQTTLRRIRLVGVSNPALSSLGDRPGVTIVGQVPDIEVELARADLVVVPLRFGSGTRLKVLEAFAQRVPVVSTTLGAEGLGEYVQTKTIKYGAR